MYASNVGQVRDDVNAMTWVLAGYEGADIKRPLDVVATGSGGLSELTEQLLDDQVMYGLLRTSDVIDAINTVKFVYIYW